MKQLLKNLAESLTRNADDKLLDALALDKYGLSTLAGDMRLKAQLYIEFAAMIHDVLREGK